MKIGNFIIEQDGNTYIFNYQRSLKDWLDLITSAIAGLFCLGVTILFIVLLITEFKVLYLFLGAVFGFGTYLFGGGAVARIFMRTHDTLVIDTTTHTLTTRYYTDKTVALHFSDIVKITAKMHTELIKYKGQTQTRIFFAINALTKGGGSEVLLNVNPTQIISTNDGGVGKELNKIGQALAKFIAEKTGAQFTV